jgi:hypothetical protein
MNGSLLLETPRPAARAAHNVDDVIVAQSAWALSQVSGCSVSLVNTASPHWQVMRARHAAGKRGAAGGARLPSTPHSRASAWGGRAAHLADVYVCNVWRAMSCPDPFGDSARANVQASARQTGQSTAVQGEHYAGQRELRTWTQAICQAGSTATG